MDRFFQSIDYIEDHLHDRISVHDIAKSAFYSTYYYCRVFRALVGDTPKEYLRKRRLTVAATKLLTEEVNILNLAFDCQFESQEAFTRAFKNHFKITPAKYRKNQTPTSVLYRNRFKPESLHYLQNSLTMEPEILTQSEIKTVGILAHYQEEDFDLLKIWQPLSDFGGPIPNCISDKGFGLYEASVLSDGSPGFSYVCAMQVADFSDVPEGMVSRVIPQQLYAKFTHLGPLENLDETLKYIWGSWLPKSNYRYVETTDFELYPADFDSKDANAQTFLHIPIQLK